MRASNGKKTVDQAVNQHQSVGPGTILAAGVSSTTRSNESDQEREDREVVGAETP